MISVVSAETPNCVTRANENFRWLACAAVLVFLSGCDSKPEIIRISGEKLGTQFRVTVVADQPAPADLPDQIAALIDSVDRSMSTYRSDSELSLFNVTAVNEPVRISADFAKVMALSSEVWTASDSLFDPTVGPLVDLWGFGPKVSLNAHIPSAEEIQSALSKIGFGAVLLNADEQGYSLAKSSNVRIDLSGIAKGYAVDLVANQLEMLALTDYLVEIGGEVRVSGDNPRGKRWRVAIEVPQITGGVERVLELKDSALATSGDYRNFFEFEGKRYSHIIDPRDGHPVEHATVSATVVMDSCAKADAWSTAFLIMGQVEAMAIANQRGIALYIITRGVKGFEAFKSIEMESILALAG
ncbi:MAG: thiamine biosynthesis protein ApbE [Porticoccaceae bacterium]|nr:thiamine biosynthesis protein ApbE [Porticoccaceae bacterium]